jgi:hypothetical protein
LAGCLSSKAFSLLHVMVVFREWLQAITASIGCPVLGVWRYTPQAPAGAKRPASQLLAATPQPPKRSKPEGGAQKAAPATAPPKVAAGQAKAKATPGGGGEGDYLSSLKAYLSSKGPTKLAALGSAVKRPPKAPKLKHYLEQHAGTFKYDLGTDTVSLK